MQEKKQAKIKAERAAREEAARKVRLLGRVLPASVPPLQPHGSEGALRPSATAPAPCPSCRRREDFEDHEAQSAEEQEGQEGQHCHRCRSHNRSEALEVLP